MKLKDIYSPETVTIHMGDDLASAARRMELTQVGALAVVDEAAQLVGMFTERDLVRAIAWADNPAGVLVSAYASPRPETADVEEDSRDVARRMLDLGVRHLPVTVGDDQLVGMVSMRDLLAVEPGCREASWMWFGEQIWSVWRCREQDHAFRCSCLPIASGVRWSRPRSG